MAGNKRSSAAKAKVDASDAKEQPIEPVGETVVGAAAAADDDEKWESDEYYDSDDDEGNGGEDEGDTEGGEEGEEDDSEEEEDDEFERQESSDEDDDEDENDADSDDSGETDGVSAKFVKDAEDSKRSYDGVKTPLEEFSVPPEVTARLQRMLDTDDLSSDDEEAEGNTIGRVPLHWYDAFDHIGYDATGAKMMRRKTGDRIDMTIANRDDPAARRTVYDMYNDREVVLTERDLEIIRRMQAGAFAHPEHNDTPDYIDYISCDREVMPLSAAPEPKARFLPSKWEMMKVMKIVKAIKEGRYKDRKPAEKSDLEKAQMLMIWNEEEDEVLAESRRFKFHLPAPKMPLPGHAESYNPPREYLLTPDEEARMLDQDPKDRAHNFIPKAHDCLRRVAGYENFVKERFERCLDLYLCPRKMKRRLNIDPETLVPRLPKPSELRPYPNNLCIQFLGHKGPVRAISVSPDGQYMVSGGDDGTVRLWELDTSLCKYVWQLSEEGGDSITSLQWNPNPSHQLVAAAVGNVIVLIATGTGDADSCDVTETLLLEAQEQASKNAVPEGEEDEEEEPEGEEEEQVEDDANKKASKRVVATWHPYGTAPDGKFQKTPGPKNKRRSLASAVEGRCGVMVGPRLELRMRSRGGRDSVVTSLVWHHKGDYLATLTPNAGAQAVAIHQLSKGKTQCPFTRSPGTVQCLSFHPSRPFLFVATQIAVKVYHLVEQRLVKKLMSGCKCISSIDMHHSGDHVIIGSYDRRVVWFDLDLSSTPYKTLKFHEKAVRCVQFHKRYPLMASASDDGNIHIFHSTVYSDLSKNPMIVPLKVLRGHGVIGGVGVLSIAFHPRQPWVLSAGADGVINLFQDV